VIKTIIVYDNLLGYEIDVGEPVEVLTKRLLETVCDELKCEYESECSLIITTKEDIKELNNEHRNVDAVTDVLSFPAIDFTKPCDYDIIDENDYSMFNPETGHLMLGDIVICADKVYSQAEEYGHSVKREFSFLIVHSILHLFGFDHMEDEERLLMELKQREILDLLKITR